MCQEKYSNKINETIKDTLKNLKDIIDVNTVIGEPKTLNDSVIIPISNITTCFICGGGEYGKVSIFNKNDLPFSAGNSAVVSIKPIGFLVKEDKEKYRLLNVNDNSLNKLSSAVIDKIIEKVKIK